MKSGTIRQRIREIACLLWMQVNLIANSSVFWSLTRFFFFFFQKTISSRKFFSHKTWLLLFTNDLCRAIASSLTVDCVFLDFQKALDSVSHNLFLKLSKLNIDPNILGWLKFFLTDSSMFPLTGMILLSQWPQACLKVLYEDRYFF